DGPQAETLPSTSTPRNWTSVWPSAVTVADDPADGSVQLAPPSVEVRTSYPAKPAAASAEAEAATVTDATLCQAGDPPETDGVVGPVRSSITVLPASGTLGAHAETLPAPSMLRYCTTVVPSPVTAAGLDATGAVQLTPLSTDSRY